MGGGGEGTKNQIFSIVLQSMRISSSTLSKPLNLFPCNMFYKDEKKNKNFLKIKKCDYCDDIQNLDSNH